MIELQVNIKDKQFSHCTTVIENIEFTLGSGEFVAIIGPSGCGKTTLLNMISGLESSSAGSIMLNGQPLEAENKPHIGYIFQQPRLMPWLTVRQNLQLVAESATSEEIGALLHSVGLGDKDTYYPRQLSGGMQRRVSVARAFLINPQLLLLDEPFNSLDAPTAARLRLLLIELCQRQGCTVVFVTHELSEAIYLADRILFLSPSPSRIVHQELVSIPRPRNEAGLNELKWQAQLMASHPQLLAGRVS